VELTLEERARIDEIARRPAPKDRYEVDGFRGLFPSKREASAERKRMAKARDAWLGLDERTKDWLRWELAHRTLDVLAANSAAVAALSDDERSHLCGEIAIGHQFVENPAEDEPAEILGSGNALSPLDPPALLDACADAMILPPHGVETLPNLRAVVRELYAIWRRDQLVGEPKVAAEAIAAIGDEVAQRYRLPAEDARRRVRVSLRELDARNELPLR